MTATLPLDGLGPDQSAPVLVDWTPTSPLRGILVMAAIVAVLAFLVVRNRRAMTPGGGESFDRRMRYNGPRGDL